MEDSEFLKEAFEAYSCGDFITALNKAMPFAEKGLKEAQAFVGSLYQLGLGTDVNGKKAVYWYEKAVAQNEPTACNNLAWIYELGLIGISQNLKRSKELKEKAEKPSFMS